MKNTSINNDKGKVRGKSFVDNEYQPSIDADAGMPGIQ